MVRRRPILKPVTRARRIALSISAGGFGLVGVLVAGRGTATSSTPTRATTVDPASSSSAADDGTTFSDDNTNTTTTWSARAPSTTSNAPSAAPQGRTRVS